MNGEEGRLYNSVFRGGVGGDVLDAVCIYSSLGRQSRGVAADPMWRDKNPKKQQTIFFF